MWGVCYNTLYIYLCEQKWKAKIEKEKLKRKNWKSKLKSKNWKAKIETKSEKLEMNVKLYQFMSVYNEISYVL